MKLFLFGIIELISMLMTATVGTIFYVAGFMISVVYRLIRWIYRTLKGGATA